MKVPRKKIDKLILMIKSVQNECKEPETMFVYHALDKALSHIGWTYADFLIAEKEKARVK